MKVAPRAAMLTTRRALALALLDDLAVDRHPLNTPALVAVAASGGVRRLTFGDVATESHRAAAWLRERGVVRGDRVAIVLPQLAATAALHVACARVGAIATPLSPLFGPEGLAERLADSAPRLVATDAQRRDAVSEALALTKGDAGIALVDPAPWEGHVAVPGARTHARLDDPAWLVYTSGTTGGPKGVLLPHRVLPGRMPGFRLAHDPFGPGDVFSSPADWSWIGGLLDGLFAPWHEGGCVLAQERRGPFDPDSTLRLYAEHGVTHAFLPPTALKAIARSGARVPAGWRLRVAQSAGEPLPPAVRAWAREHLADTVTEVYGLTEAAYLVGTATRAYATPSGSMGRPFPGHLVEVVDEEICVRNGDPTLMLGYWRGEGRAPDLPLDDAGRFHTGDLAGFDDGFLRFLGRRDDLIKTSGYRVGPAEVEACLLHHPAVAECAVVGVPDAERGQSIKAFVKPAPGHVPGAALERALAEHVRARLAAHAYPREIEFVAELPLTVTGKIRRRELRGGVR